MRDGQTIKLDRAAQGDAFAKFLELYRPKLVLVSGTAAGQEFAIERGRQTLGRGPGVDLSFEDPSMSRQHLIIEFVGEGFRVRDLDSTNGLVVNGAAVAEADLAHGDRLEFGSHGFLFLVEDRDEELEAYELPSE